MCWSAHRAQGGQFNWKEIDDFIEQFKQYGKKTAFGVMNVSTGIGHYVTPKWVFDAGTAPLAVKDNSSPTGRRSSPRTWDDPVFLRKFKAFVRALGKHYDGQSDIAFIDIRSYGNWGEGHIGMLECSGYRPHAAGESQDNYFLPYFQAFPIRFSLSLGAAASTIPSTTGLSPGEPACDVMASSASGRKTVPNACGTRPPPVRVRVLRRLRRNEEERLVETRHAEGHMFPAGNLPTCSGTRGSSRRTVTSA